MKRFPLALIGFLVSCSEPPARPPEPETNASDAAPPAPPAFKATAIAAGAGFTCAYHDGGVYCWGEPRDLAFGNEGAPLEDRLLPERNAFSFPDLHALRGDVLGMWASAADNIHYGWGALFSPSATAGRCVEGCRLVFPEPTVFSFFEIPTTGFSHACYRSAEGEVSCMGRNDRGQLARPKAELPSSAALVPVSLPARTVRITSGLDHNCALLEDGDVWCWGANTHGEVGLATREDAFRPARVPITGVKDLSASAMATCALTEGEAWCWGKIPSFAIDYRGAVLDTAEPVRMLGANRPLTALFAASYSFGQCAIDDTRRLWCFGDNGWGELGDRTWVSRNRWALVSGIERDRIADVATPVSLGSTHACAIVGDGSLYCWGDNARGQLGDGSRQSRPFASRVLPH